MTNLREAAKAALWAFELHVQMTWPTDRSTAAIANLRAALAQQDEPTRSLSSAGFKPRDTRLTCDECGGKFARQMLPIHKGELAQEPMAWYFEARHIDSAWGAAVSLKHPGPEGVYTRNVKPLYTAPPQHLPQTLDDAMRLTRARAQAYENGYRAGIVHERERIIQFLREMQRVVGDAHNYYGVAAMRIRERV